MSRVALVTGAGGGVGQVMATQLARAGYDLALTSRSAAKLQTTVGLVAAEHPEQQVLQITADLTQPQQVGDCVRQTVDRFGRLDVIAHIAGDAPLLTIDQITADTWQRCIDVNVSSLMHLTAAAWPSFKQQGSGFVLAISSLASVDPFPGFSLYAPAKAAVNMFIHCVSQEGQAFGVRSVAIAPGAIETPMLRGLFDESMVPRDQALAPAAVASLATDCITGERDFTPGETILMNSP